MGEPLWDIEFELPDEAADDFDKIMQYSSDPDDDDAVPAWYGYPELLNELSDMSIEYERADNSFGITSWDDSAQPMCEALHDVMKHHNVPGIITVVEWWEGDGCVYGVTKDDLMIISLNQLAKLSKDDFADIYKKVRHA